MKIFNAVMDFIEAQRPDFRDFRKGFFWDLTVAALVLVVGVFVSMLAGLDREGSPSIAGIVIFAITFVAGFLLIQRGVYRARRDAGD